MTSTNEILRGFDFAEATLSICGLGDGRSGGPADLSRFAAQPKAPAAIARKEEK